MQTHTMGFNNKLGRSPSTGGANAEEVSMTIVKLPFRSQSHLHRSQRFRQDFWNQAEVEYDSGD